MYSALSYRWSSLEGVGRGRIGNTVCGGLDFEVMRADLQPGIALGARAYGKHRGVKATSERGRWSIRGEIENRSGAVGRSAVGCRTGIKDPVREGHH